MLINWKIPFPLSKLNWTNKQLADFIMPKFGLDQDQYEDSGLFISGSPSTISTFWITPVKFAVYDITIQPDSNKDLLLVRIRLYKAVAYSTLFIVAPLIIDINSTSSNIAQHLIEGIFAFILSSLFFMGLAYIELLIDKADIAKKIKLLN